MATVRSVSLASLQTSETPSQLLAVYEVDIAGKEPLVSYAYLSGDLAQTTLGIGYSEGRAIPPSQGQTLTGPAAAFDWFADVQPTSNPDFFVGLVPESATLATFTWSDVFSFMWFESFTEAEYDRFDETRAPEDFFYNP